MTQKRPAFINEDHYSAKTGSHSLWAHLVTVMCGDTGTRSAWWYRRKRKAPLTLTVRDPRYSGQMNERGWPKDLPPEGGD